VQTVDKNQKDATDPAFDPKSIVQYGFEAYRDDIRGIGSFFGPGNLAGPDGKTVVLPEAWKDAWRFWYDSMWKTHITATGPVFNSAEFNGGGYPFFSGKVAMQQNYLWSLYGVSGAGDDWDLAALPSYKGTTTASFNADTFRIMKSTKHPDEAFEALSYLLTTAHTELLQAYGGLPAIEAERQAWFDAKDEEFLHPTDPAVKPHVGPIDWQVAIDGIQYADNPNWEAAMPKYNETLDTLVKYRGIWWGTAGLDMEAQFAQLTAEIQAIWDKP
jgi:multiple sugar transport system substrate-binding protein